MKTSNLLKLLNLTIIVFLFASCQESEVVHPPVAFDIPYTHTFQNCEMSEYPEINCSEFVIFNENSKASLLLGGGDIVNNYDFLYVGGTIHVSSCCTFKIVDHKTIIRTQDNSTWIAQ